MGSETPVLSGSDSRMRKPDVFGKLDERPTPASRIGGSG